MTQSRMMQNCMMCIFNLENKHLAKNEKQIFFQEETFGQFEDVNFN